MKRCTDSYREPLQQVISGILVNRLVLKISLADAPRVNRYALLLAFLLGLRGLSSGLHRAIRSGIKISSIRQSLFGKVQKISPQFLAILSKMRVITKFQLC